MKFATKRIQQYPPHLRHVTTLPWEIKSQYFADIKQMWKDANKFWYFCCLKYGVLLYTDCKQNFPCLCSFTYLLLWSIYGTRNSSQQMSLQCLSTNNMVSAMMTRFWQKKRLYRYSKRYTTKRLTDKFPEKKAGQSIVLISCWISCETGTVDIATKRNHTTTGSFQSHPHFTKENNYAFECLIF